MRQAHASIEAACKLLTAAWLNQPPLLQLQLQPLSFQADQ